MTASTIRCVVSIPIHVAVVVLSIVYVDLFSVSVLCVLGWATIIANAIAAVACVAAVTSESGGAS